MDLTKQNGQQQEGEDSHVGQQPTQPTQPTQPPPGTEPTAFSEDTSAKHVRRGDTSVKSGGSRTRKWRGFQSASPRKRTPEESTPRRASAAVRDRLWRTVVCLSMAVLVVVSALLFTYLLFIKDPLQHIAVCQTEDCMAHATELLSTLNRLADPCHDFYDFACGKPDQRRPLQSLVERMYLNTIDSGSSGLDGNAAAWSRVCAELLFQSCVAPKRGEIERSLAEFLEFRRQRGMLWPEEPQAAVGGVDPLDLMLDLAINWNLNMLFDVRVLELPWYTSSATRDRAVALVLSRGKLNYVWQEGVRRSVDQTQYESYLQEYYQVLSVTGANVSATMLRELEEAIVAAKLDVVADESEQAWFKMRELDNVTFSVEPGAWLALLNKQFAGQFIWTKEHWIVVDGPAVLARLDTLLKTYSKHVLVVGLAWVFIQTHLWAVANKPDLVFAKRPGKSRKYGCFEYAESLFGLLSVANQLTRTFGPLDARHHVSYFERELRSAAAKKLRDSSWIHDGAREAAVRKLKSLAMALLPPSEFFDKEWRQAIANAYAEAGKTQAGFVSNLLSASRSYRALRAEQSQFADVYGRRMFPSDRHASYVYIANRADVALGSVAPPLYYLNGTFAVNYAGLGTVVAALLASSFDPHGSGLGSSGTNARWWNQTDYFDRVECELGNEEGNHSAYRTVQVFPSVVALEIAFAAYKDAVAHDPRKLPDFRLRYLEAFKDDQIFFISYCHAICGNGASSRDRCNLPLRHFRPFVDAFGCSHDSPMNANGQCSFFGT